MNVRRRIGYVLVAIAGCSGQGQDSAQERPNILLVFTDDHAAHAVSAYGSVLNQTPNIDR
ncbi:MAG: hypothetical protein HOA23_08420, partial [Gemmatimonadales bacterium]|nr:hypothetical protein [Gemmatimonadales bacterium]